MRSRVVLSGALAVALLLPQANLASAGPESEIPGIPLIGSAVTGRLGGPIVDVVYWVDVPAQRVLVLSLTGSAGTDFDLYLFDDTATSVYSKVGLVAKSTGPTSTESLSYLTVGGGRFYIDLSGFSETQGDYRLSVVFGNDEAPPRTSLTLNGGAPATNSRDAVASVVATDDLSGVSDMQFSLDGTSWEPWQPWQVASPRQLVDTDGRQDLWVRVRDRQGNVSAAARASIVLDRNPPGVVARLPQPGGTAIAPRPTISIQFSEPIRVAQWQSFGLILQDGVGTIIYGTYGWDATTNTGIFVPSSDLLPGATYVVSLGAISDLAGNALPPLGTWTMRPLLAPRITLTASPRVALPRSSIVLAGGVDARPAGSFVLEQLVADGTWQDVETLLPDEAGSFSTKVIVDRTSSFRVAYLGDQTSAPSVSPGVRVAVRRTVAATGPGTSILRLASSGQRITVTAILTPTAPATPVTMMLSRYDPVRRNYRVVARLTRTSASGRATFLWRASSPGRYTVRLSTPATAAFAAGLSPMYRWIIR